MSGRPPSMDGVPNGALKEISGVDVNRVGLSLSNLPGLVDQPREATVALTPR